MATEHRPASLVTRLHSTAQKPSTSISYLFRVEIILLLFATINS
jgi:hypothetical protein